MPVLPDEARRLQHHMQHGLLPCMRVVHYGGGHSSGAGDTWAERSAELPTTAVPLSPTLAPLWRSGVVGSSLMNPMGTWLVFVSLASQPLRADAAALG